MTLSKFLTASLTVLALFGCRSEENHSDTKSNYPPDYSWELACKESNEFRVCQRVNGGDRADLFVEYRGYLKDADQLSVYVKLNDRDGVFPLTRPYGNPRVLLSKDSYNCHSAANSGGWDCDQPTDEMRNLFFYARQSYRINAWDIELAVVDGNGQWDSSLGGNYKFRFDQYPNY